MPGVSTFSEDRADKVDTICDAIADFKKIHHSHNIFSLSYLSGLNGESDVIKCHKL